MSGPTPLPAMRLQIHGVDQMDRLARALAVLVEPNDVIALIGDLGTGKTTLVRSLATALGVPRDEVTSPTYVLIHEYQGRLPVFHFDAYRLPDCGPFEALGVHEYWNAGGVCLVEWADRVWECLPDRAWRIEIAHDGPDARRLSLWLSLDVRQALVAELAEQAVGD